MKINKINDTMIDVNDGLNIMGWVLVDNDTWVKYYAYINKNSYRIKDGVWTKRGRGKTKNDDMDILRNMEIFFRNNLK